MTSDAQSPLTAYAESARLSDELGRRLKLLVAGDHAGAEALALAARDAGCDVVYLSSELDGLRLAVSAEQEGAHAIALSLSDAVKDITPISDALARRQLKLPLVILSDTLPAINAEATATRLVAAGDYGTALMVILALVASAHGLDEPA